MRAILDVVFVVLNAYQWIIIAAAVMSWLIAFNVVNMHNELARGIWNFLVGVTEPSVAPDSRHWLPRMGTSICRRSCCCWASCCSRTSWRVTSTPTYSSVFTSLSGRAACDCRKTPS